MIADEFFHKYTKQLQSLNRASNKMLSKAPHKLILLLSITQLIHIGEIQSNRIFITGELLTAFKSNWAKLVNTNYTSNFSLSFFHLGSEPFAFYFFASSRKAFQ